jgi:hypothetical protein
MRQRLWIPGFVLGSAQLRSADINGNDPAHRIDYTVAVAGAF